MRRALRAGRGGRAGVEAQRRPGVPRSTRSPFSVSRSRLTQRGFSLLEIIAAVLLLAIAFGALMRVAGSSLNLTTRAAERSEAALWARSLLDSAFVLEPIRVGSSSGRFDARYRWQLQVTPFNPAAGSPASGAPALAPGAVPLRLFRLDLDVLWHASGHDYSARFSTLRLSGPDSDVGSTP